MVHYGILSCMTHTPLTDVLSRLKAAIPRGGRKGAARELGISVPYLTAILLGRKKNPSPAILDRLNLYADRYAPPQHLSLRAQIDGLLANLVDDEDGLREVHAVLQRLLIARWARVRRAPSDASASRGPSQPDDAVPARPERPAGREPEFDRRVEGRPAIPPQEPVTRVSGLHDAEARGPERTIGRSRAPQRDGARRRPQG
jgi:hypothetical protein